MPSVPTGTLIAAGLIFSCCYSTQLYCATSTISPHPVRRASAQELDIPGRGNAAPSKSIAVTQRRTEMPAGAPYSSPTTPNVGSPEWKRDAAETARREKELARVLKGICRGC